MRSNHKRLGTRKVISKPRGGYEGKDVEKKCPKSIKIIMIKSNGGGEG